MGYNSDVSIAVYGDEAQMLALIAAQRIKGAKWLEDDGCYAVRKYGNARIAHGFRMLMIYASFESVSWTTHYPWVASWIELLSDAMENFGDNINTEFVRIGDDTDDIEQEYDGNNVHCYTGVTRELHQEFPKFESSISWATRRKQHEYD